MNEYQVNGNEKKGKLPVNWWPIDDEFSIIPLRANVESFLLSQNSPVARDRWQIYDSVRPARLRCLLCRVAANANCPILLAVFHQAHIIAVLFATIIPNATH